MQELSRCVACLLIIIAELHNGVDKNYELFVMKKPDLKLTIKKKLFKNCHL